MNSVKRPKTSETEDDLLKQQKEFLAQNKLKNKANNEEPNADKSSVKTIADNHDIPPIVCNIVEKNVSNVQFGRHKLSHKLEHKGFPKPKRINVTNSETKRANSLFAQQFRGNNAKHGNQFENSNVGASVVVGSGLGVQDWQNQITSIRKENEELLSNLSADEICEMRRELTNKLGPNLIEFIMNKTRVKNSVNSNRDVNSTKAKLNHTNNGNDKQLKISLPVSETEIKKNKWLNMDVIEKEKLAWTADLPDVQTHIPDAITSYTARFNFDGLLIYNNEEIAVHEGLHHHSEEPANAGYCIQELLTLLQSSFSSQKIIAIQILAKIFERSYKGLYDCCFNENIINQLLENSSVVLQIRLCLDDNSETIWKAAIIGLNSIVCNTVVDEAYLDRAFLLLNDKLSDNDLHPHYDSNIKIDELSDQQFCQLDIIECLVNRTNLLQRIRFLLNSNKTLLELKYANKLLEILIRIARHSSDARKSIVNCSRLLEVIIKNYLPISINFSLNSLNRANIRALKLIRLLINGNSEACIKLLFDFPSLIDSLKVYLTLNPENCNNSSEILELSIEALRVWFTIISQNVVVSDFLDLYPIIIKQLQFCQTLNPISHTNSFDWHYASTLLAAIKYVVIANPSFSGFNELVCVTLFKWLSFIKNVEIIPNFDANVAILSAIEFILVTNIDANLLIDNVISHVINNPIILNKLVDLQIENSNLIHMNIQTQGNIRDSQNLPSFGSIYYRKLQTIVILNDKSSVCLLYAIVRVLSTFSNETLTINLIRNEHIRQYINQIIKNIRAIKLNVFDLYELNLLIELCLLSASMAKTESDFTELYCYLNLSILMVSFVKNEEQKINLVNRVIFNNSLHCQQLSDRLSSISLNDNCSRILNCDVMPKSFDQIKASYLKYSFFDSSYWLFDPLIKSLKTEQFSNDDILNCLYFINLIITYHQNYFSQIVNSTSTVFCLISSVFLLPNQIYFDLSAQTLLTELLIKLLKIGINCEFNDQIPYFASIGNFFSQFISQYESVSYANKLFANYLLVFIQRKCTKMFRIKLYSDNSTAMRILNNDFNEILISINNFLFPIEDDYETLEIYLKALLCEMVTPKCSPLLYLMAIHHLNNALFRSPNANVLSKTFTFNKLIRSVNNSQNNELKNHLLNYSHFDINCSFGLFLNK